MNEILFNPLNSEGVEISRTRGCRRGRCAQGRRTHLGRVVFLATIVCLMILAPLGLAQERPMSETPPPTDVTEIKTPIQQVFPVEPPRPSLFGPKDPDMTPFLADSRFEMRFRSYNWKQDGFDASVSEDWAVGGSLYYRSGRAGNFFDIELEGFTSQPLWAPDDRLGGGNLSPDGSGYSVLGIANANFHLAGLTLRAGRQYHDLPYMNKAWVRITPNTFEAITLEKPKGQVKFTAGYTSKIKSRYSESFVSMTEHIGLDEDHGLIHGGLVWDPQENFSIGAIGQVLPDVFSGVYGEALWFKAKPSDNLGFRLDSQGTYEGPHGDNLKNINNAWNAALRGSMDYGKLMFRLGFSITGPEAIQSPFGLQPSYVDLMSRTFTKADEKAILGSVSYDFSGVGAKGFKAVLNYVQSYDAIYQGDRIRAREADLSFDYRGHKGWSKGLWVRLRQAFRNESWSDKNLYQLRLQVYYTVNVI